MPAETAVRTIEVPGFSYRGFAVPTLNVVYADPVGSLSVEEPADRLVPDSITLPWPLPWWLAYYVIGRDVETDEPLVRTVSGSAREAGSLVYESCQARKGKVRLHRDAVLYMRGGSKPKGSIALPGSVQARYFRDIAAFKRDGDDWKIEPSWHTEEYDISLPEGHGSFIVPTTEGAINPLTGTPFETIADRKAAIARWMESGLTDRQAEAELSRFYRADEGLVAVLSCSSADDGPASILLDIRPGDISRMLDYI